MNERFEDESAAQDAEKSRRLKLAYAAIAIGTLLLVVFVVAGQTT